MKITASDFSNSFFYIGPGYDFQPLLRFTHLCDKFIYTNLFIDQERMEEWYDFALRYHKDLEVVTKKVISNFDEEEHFELHEDYLSHLTNPNFLKLEALKGYQNTFSMALGRDQFALEYTVLRKSLNRKIKLFIITAEGLASYILLSHNGRYAPKILCTVQTGALEHPDGLMNDYFMDQTVSRPFAWVRGFEPVYSPFRIKNNTLENSGEFPNKIMDFTHRWYCGWSYRGQTTNKRYCKVFTSNEGLKKISETNWKEEFQTGKNKLINGSIFSAIEESKNHDYFIVPNSIKDSFPPEAAVLTWKNGNDFWQLSPVRSQMDRLFETLEDKNISSNTTLHIVPGCMEDEGELYHQILHESKYKSVTYLNSPFDFIDLKT